ncbi:MAG: thermonuclease family protein [Gallionella sp.]|nr:thermonuclease family protein [Gallionella sp.]
MNFFSLLICTMLLSASGVVQGAVPQSDAAHVFTAKVIAVLDGDTVLIRRGGGMVKIRLAEIDAPEVAHAGTGGQMPDSQNAQPFGENSKRSLSGMVLGKQVDVVTQAVDQYGRLVAKLSVDGRDVNAEQVRRGMAWAVLGWRQSRRTPSGVPLRSKQEAHSATMFLGEDPRDLAGKSYQQSHHPLLALQAEARQARRGLWVQPVPIPPRDWRKQHPAQPHSVTKSPVPDDCGNKKYCSEMRSCDEARYYLTQCGVGSLDGNGDGLPCERLCAAATGR